MLSKFSVKKPYTIVVAVIIVLLLGTISFMNLQTDLLPSIDLPYVVVVTSYPGASPEEVETMVTKPIEQVVATTNNIKNVSSISNENSSTVILEFNNDVNMDSAIIEINGSLDMIKGMWSDTVGSPMVIRLNPDMLPIMISSVDVEGMSMTDVSKLVNERIIPEFESINGVASVSGAGLLEEKIEVSISQEKIDSLNKKILEKIDSKLSEAENKLLDAKKEIASGKAKLIAEEKKQMDAIYDGEKAINLGKEQILLVETKINEGLIELNKSKTELEDALVEIDKNEQLLKQQEKELSTNDNLTNEEKIKLEGIKQSLATLEGKKLETQIGLEFMLNKLNEVQKEKDTFEAKKQEIIIKEEELLKGKELLTNEMNKAKSQLASGEREINNNLDKLESSKEEAFKKASLDEVISPKMISGILTAQNFSMPAGYIEEASNEYLVKVGDKIKDLEEIKGLLLFDTGEDAIGKVHLKDVADISYKDNSDEIYAKVNGNNAVMLTFQKQSNFPTAEVAKNIRDRITRLSSEIEGLSITPLMDQGIYIDIVVDSVLDNILYGGVLAILILILFLKDIKPTFIIAVSIPISIIFAVAMMYFTGVTLNIISLAGLALGVGMLVDNSIVVIENIYRFRSEGMSAPKAAIEGAKEVSGAIVASTLTTVCVFLPIVFTKGISKQLFADMGLTIFYSLLASLIVALTLVPTMGSSMLKRTKETNHRLYDIIIDSYEKLLRWSLKYKVVVMIFVVALFGISTYFTFRMGTSFIPEMDAPQMSFSIEMPKNSSQDDLIKMSDMVIDRIMDVEGIQTIGAFKSQGMGMSAFGRGNRNNSNSMSIYLVLDENKKIVNADIGKEIINRTKDLDIKVNIQSSNMDMSALGGSGIEVFVKGKELDTLRDIAGDVSRMLEEIEGTKDVKSGLDNNVSEVRITVNKEKSMENGLTVAQVFTSVNEKLSKGKTATTISTSNKDYPLIVVEGDNKSIKKIDLDNISIEVNKNGEKTEVKLSDIAKVTDAVGPSSIRRESQQRYISITAKIDDEHNIGLLGRELENKLKGYKLADGYSIKIAGENELIKNSQKDLINMILLAIALIYLIMVAQFQSLISPFIVMFTIPLAFTGGLLALLITGYDLSIISMLGFLVLSGVVVNNGIVFVDFTNQLREKGMNTREALVYTGKTRMRPILMTAITTILGLSTLSIGVGVGSELLQPLAIVSIGGLTYATLLTLLVVPAMYELLHKNTTRKIFDEEDDVE